MKLIVGLGNPGDKYIKNRHNVGFMVVDRLIYTLYHTDKWEDNRKFKSRIFKPESGDVIFAKPETFMNQSGYPAKIISSFYKIHPEDIWVIHDDLDIKLGLYKIQKARGPKVHYGVNSIEDKIETKYFWRVRIGVDNRTEGNRIPGEEYVLKNFEADEENILEDTIKQVVEDLSHRIFKS